MLRVSFFSVCARAAARSCRLLVGTLGSARQRCCSDGVFFWCVTKQLRLALGEQLLSHRRIFFYQADPTACKPESHGQRDAIPVWILSRVDVQPSVARCLLRCV